MLSFTAGEFAIRICTNCCFLSHLPWAWGRSAPTGWLIRFALPTQSFYFKGTVVILGLWTSVLIPCGAREWHVYTIMHWFCTNQLAGNHGECQETMPQVRLKQKASGAVSQIFSCGWAQGCKNSEKWALCALFPLWLLQIHQHAKKRSFKGILLW